jgi:hypothetical protein
MISSSPHKQRRSRGMVVVALVCVVALVALMAAVVGGCGKASLVGKWANSDNSVTMEFKSDGTVSSPLFAGATPDYKAENGKLIITVAGVEAANVPYTLNGDTLTITDPDTGETDTLMRVK